MTLLMLDLLVYVIAVGGLMGVLWAAVLDMEERDK
jgi:hypothetical protein